MQIQAPILLTVTLAVLLGCGANEPPVLNQSQATEGSEIEPPVLAPSTASVNLVVTADDAPITFRSARAFTRGNRGIEVVLSTALELACEGIEARRAPRGEKRFRVRLNQQYESETGKLKWVAFKPQSEVGTLRFVRQVEVQEADARLGGRVAANIDLGFVGGAMRAKVLDVRGSFEATGCGDYALPVPDPTIPRLTVEVGKETFELSARVVDEHGRRRVVLTSQPMGCVDPRTAVDIGLSIELDESGRVGTSLSIWGDRFKGSSSISAQDAPTVTLKDVREANGRWSAEARGSEMIDGTSIRFAGQVDALVCAASGP